VSPLYKWPFWKRAVFTNAIAAVGVYIGFAQSDVRLSISLKVHIAVFTIAFMNLMFLVIGPGIYAQKTEGRVAPALWHVMYEALSERPLIIVLVILQLLGTSRATATAIAFMQATASDYVRSLPTAHSMSLRLMGASVLMAGVAVLWLLGAIGLWRSYSWGWWLALVLNGLDAAVTAVLQMLKPTEFLLDMLAVTAVVLLLLRPVRTGFRKRQTAVERVGD